MRARCDNKHDRLAWLNQTIAMNGDDAFEGPAGGCLLRDAVDFVFCHAGIMLDFERRERAPFVTAKPGECDERANITAPLRQRGSFQCRVKNFFLDTYDNPSAHGLIPSLEENDPSAPAVMARLDPAIQTCSFRDWMPGSSPGMTTPVTNTEINYYPPVIGGKNAISRAFPIKASCLTWVRSIAARIDLICAKAAA
jgi:hypothetical protein